VFSELPRRRARARSLLVVAAAGLIAAAVVATLVVPGLLRAQPTASPRRPAPASTSSAASRPSMLVVPGAGWVRMDWSGNRLDSFRLPATPNGYLQATASPDGTMVVAQAFRGGMVLVDARDGHVVATPPRLGQPGVNIAQPAILWSDDSRHLCALSGTASNLELMVAEADPLKGEGALRIVPVPGVPAAGVTFLNACSSRTDRAVISESQVVGNTKTAVVVVVRLSDGRVILHHDYPSPAPFVNVNASADGRFLVGFGDDQPVTKSVVVDLATGDVVAHIDGVGMAFSADDRYLAVSSFSSEASRAGGTGSLIDWRAGRTLWQGPGQLAIFAVQPDGEAIAVQLYTSDAGGLHDQWLIVRPDGSAISFKNQAMQP
jgi:hypothetical protein